jgi:tRNA modification GTPase
MPPLTTWRLLAPAPGLIGSAAIAVIQLTGDIDAAFTGLSIRPVAVGAVAVRSLAGVDTGLVARWSATCAYLMPHAGAAILRGLADALQHAGVPRVARDITGMPGGGTLSTDAAASSLYPEACSLIEARALATLSRAASPLAVDLLLDQPRRWRELGSTSHTPEDEADLAARAAVLNRLIDPPLVVALGRPNIGKSSLLNTLAGRAVAIVADQAGTTRDHVGVTLDLGGLTVRCIDTPGLGPVGGDPVQSAAQAIALQAATAADLILLCADRTQPFLPNPDPAVPALRVALRADLGPPPEAGDLSVSIHVPETISHLVTSLRDRLVPPSLLADPRPWRFW